MPDINIIPARDSDSVTLRSERRRSVREREIKAKTHAWHRRCYLNVGPLLCKLQKTVCALSDMINLLAAHA
jgi:hypothetical protein